MRVEHPLDILDQQMEVVDLDAQLAIHHPADQVGFAVPKFKITLKGRL